MSTTKDIKQKVKASSLSERIANLEEIRNTIISVDNEIDYWLKQASEAEDGSSWERECYKHYTSKSWLRQRLEEIAEEA